MRMLFFRFLAATSIFAIAVAGTAQDAPARPAVAFPPTPTPAAEEPPLTPEQLDTLVIPTQYLARTSDVLCIVYNGFRRSQIDPCGCVTHQLGGLDKEARVLKRIDELNIPAIQVDAGGWVRDLPDATLLGQSRGLLRGLGQMGYDAVNVGFTELALSPDDLKQMAADANVKLVSANITDQSGAPVFDPYVISEVKLTDGSTIRVGIVGVTRPRIEMSAQALDAPTSVTAGEGSGSAVALQIVDPVQAINKYVADVKDKADIVIVMDYDRRTNVDKIIGGIADKEAVDVLVMGENTQIQGNLQTLDGVHVVSGGYEGRQVGTLYVELKDKDIVSTFNRHIEVLQTIPPVPEMTELMEKTHMELDQPGPTPPTAEPNKLQL